MVRFSSLGKWISMVGELFDITLCPSNMLVDVVERQLSLLFSKLDFEFESHFRGNKFQDSTLSQFFIVWSLRKEERVAQLWLLTEANSKQIIQKREAQGEGPDEASDPFRTLSLKMKMLVLPENDTNFAWLKEQTTPDPSPLLLAFIPEVSEQTWVDLEAVTQTLLFGDQCEPEDAQDPLIPHRRLRMQLALTNLSARLLCLAHRASSTQEHFLQDLCSSGAKEETDFWAKKLVPGELSLELVNRLFDKLSLDLFGATRSASTPGDLPQSSSNSPNCTTPTNQRPPATSSPNPLSQITPPGLFVPPPPVNSPLSNELVDKMVELRTIPKKRNPELFKPSIRVISTDSQQS